MSPVELILIVLLAVAAFAAGYRIGQASAYAGREGASPVPPVDTDEGEILPGPHALPPRPRGAPPPASAGGGSDGDAEGNRPAPRGVPPRRSTTPPPASAG